MAQLYQQIGQLKVERDFCHGSQGYEPESALGPGEAGPSPAFEGKSVFPLRDQPFLDILPENCGQPGRPGFNGSDGPPVSENTLLWLPPDDRLAAHPGLPGEPQASAATDAVNGAGSQLPTPQY